MAQEIITGLTGVITMPGHTQRFFSVSINVGQALLPVPAYGGNGWETFVGGLKALNGSCAAYMTDNVAASNPFDDEVGTMTVLFKTGCSISFSAVIGSKSIVGEYGGLNIVTFSWAKNDDAAPTIVWDETP